LASVVGAHAERVARVRELKDAKGRREHGRFIFEGPTLLEEALRSGLPIEELYVGDSVYANNVRVRELDAEGTPVFIIDERTARKLSDLETTTGLIGVTRQRHAELAAILASRFVLVLADLNDPGNVGTLLRSAEAFGATGVVLGRMGVDPYHPKVVRGAMGSLFRLPIAVASAEEFAAAADPAVVVGLSAGGEDLAAVSAGSRTVLLVGHERRGLGPWEASAGRKIGIPMYGPAESLNAAVAGSVALYALSGRLSREP
jgi:RNA methyltransferase, TrmH family